MSKVISVVWKCDRCGKEVSTKDHKKPSSASDPWSYVKVDQDAGFDHHGSPWAPRMRGPVVLCGACTELVIQALIPVKNT